VTAGVFVGVDVGEGVKVLNGVLLGVGVVVVVAVVVCVRVGAGAEPIPPKIEGINMPSAIKAANEMNKMTIDESRSISGELLSATLDDFARDKV
jgi:hypothetical protein